jgi:alkanesulfonate monooxygenase SsuD/methylene tetrahydromethanopterin reductase-like flavin-dependent oxidoreductase (luciferase family)
MSGFSPVSASYTEAYNVARMFASLDYLSHGRAGWNVVTSAMREEAMNFGLDANIDHGNRYARAGEYLDVVKALWDSIEEEAILLNRETGFFATRGGYIESITRESISRFAAP